MHTRRGGSRRLDHELELEGDAVAARLRRGLDATPLDGDLVLTYARYLAARGGPSAFLR